MYEQHPLSAAFPAMEPRVLMDLIEDIRVNGILEPITIFEGMVLDGWHRYKTSQILSIPCPERPLEASVDPVAYVKGLNLLRRHLTASQRAEAVVACNAWMPSGRPENNPAPGAAFSTKAMAEEAGVGERTIRQAKVAHSAGLGEAVRDGRVSVKRAAEIAKLPEPERAAAIEAPRPVTRMDGEMGEYKPFTGRDAETELQDRIREMGQMIAELQEDNESMARVFDGTDQVAAAMKEAARFREMARVLDSRVKGLTAELHEMSNAAKSWKRKFEKLQKGK